MEVVEAAGAGWWQWPRTDQPAGASARTDMPKFDWTNFPISSLYEAFCTGFGPSYTGNDTQDQAIYGRQ